MTEDQLQAAFWEKTWNNYPQARKNMWAVPNAGNRNPVEASKLKATGMLSSVWDLHLFWHGKFHIIETKVGDNQLTVDRMMKVPGSNPPRFKKVYGQKEWGELMASHGAIRHIYRTLEEGIAIFESITGLKPFDFSAKLP